MDAERRWTEFVYNGAGQVTRVTDNAGRETLSDYDALGRVVRVVSPAYTDIVLGIVKPVMTYYYNGLGKPESIASENVTYNYQYDTAHRLEKVTDSRAGKSVEHYYSIVGLLNSITDNHGNKTA